MDKQGENREERIYGDPIGDWYAERQRDEWVVYNVDGAYFTVLSYEPTPRQVGDLERVYRFGLQSGRFQGRREAQVDICRALGLTAAPAPEQE